MKPSVIDSWSASKRQRILEYYFSAQERDEDVLNSTDYYLFKD